MTPQKILKYKKLLEQERKVVLKKGAVKIELAPSSGTSGTLAQNPDPAPAESPCPTGTESLGGVRVIKGYHAEERESNVFSRGVQRLLDNVLKSLTATSLMGLTSTVVLGVVSAIIMFIGARQILAGHMTAGQLFSYTMFMGFLIAPVAQMASIGTQITEALAGLDRTREVLAEGREDQDPERTIVLGHINGAITFEDVDFSYEPGKPVLDDVSFDAQPGTVTALVGSSGSGKSTIIGLAAAFYLSLIHISEPTRP